MKFVARAALLVFLTAMIPVRARAESSQYYWSSFSASSIRQENQVSDCVEFTLRDVVRYGTIVKVSADAYYKHPTKNCGCTTPFLKYHVRQVDSSAGESSASSDWESGTVAAMPPVGTRKAFTFILTSDSEIRYTGPVVLVFTCQS